MGGFALSSIRAKSAHFNRVFIDGDTVTAVCATDGDVYFTRKLDDVGISGVVVGIVRKLEPETQGRQRMGGILQGNTARRKCKAEKLLFD